MKGALTNSFTIGRLFRRSIRFHIRTLFELQANGKNLNRLAERSAGNLHVTIPWAVGFIPLHPSKMVVKEGLPF